MPAPSDSPFFPGSLNENASHHSLETSRSTKVSDRKAVLIGPSDGKRLGDLLRPHIFSRLLDLDAFRCAGLMSKDLTSLGGHQVLNFGEAALEMGTNQLNLVHLAGDSFLTGLISGYHKVAEGKEFQKFTSLVQIAARDEMISYVKRRSGQNSSMAYVMAPKGCYSDACVSFFGLRIPEPSVLEEEQEEHLVFCAGESKFVGVSGQAAETFFKDRGINCVQMPCSLSALPTVCERPLKAAAQAASLTELREKFQVGWMAVEVGEIARNQEQSFAEALRKLATRSGLGIALYSSRHLGQDQDQLCQKWTNLIGEQASWFASDQIWEVANLIGEAAFYVGSCLDSRILATAFGVPRINAFQPSGHPITDYCQSWDMEGIPFMLSENAAEWDGQFEQAFAVSSESMSHQSQFVSGAFFEALDRAFEQTGLGHKVQLEQSKDHTSANLHGQKIANEWPDRAASAVKQKRQVAR